MIDYDPVLEIDGLIEAGKVYPGAHVCDGPRNALLQLMAESQARYQARMQVQGHQNFQERFDRVQRQLGMWADEIAAESWIEQRDYPRKDIGTEMFRCWRSSAGHWRVASVGHDLYGAAMALGRDGIWYATILVADAVKKLALQKQSGHLFTYEEGEGLSLQWEDK
jgi:hypothetical protein